MNRQDVLLDARGRIDALDAHVLLCALLGVDRAALIAHPETALTDDQAAAFADYVARCAAGEPVAYILGRRAFYDRDFTVTPDVLIPRPETELLLEQALDWTGDRSLTAADIGTGSGALAVTLAALRPNSTVHAVDASAAALAVARINAERYGAPVTFQQGDLLKPLIDAGIKLDLIMANLPYIPSGDLPDLAVSRYEPLTRARRRRGRTRPDPPFDRANSASGQSRRADPAGDRRGARRGGARPRAGAIAPARRTDPRLCRSRPDRAD